MPRKLRSLAKARSLSKNLSRAASLLAVLAVWSTALGGGFTWIDWSEIDQGGYRITSAADFVAVWTQSLEQYLERRDGVLDSRGGYFRPVYALSVSMDWMLWRATAWLYHAENVLWHLIVVCGLYVLGNRMLVQSRVANAEGIAFWSALVFAIHPLCVHSTAWISGRKDSLCAAFSIGCLIFYRRAVENDERRTTFDVISAGICLLLAIFSKEQAYVVPLFASVWTWFDWPNRRCYRKEIFTALGVLWSVNGLALFYRAMVLKELGLGGDSHSLNSIDSVGTLSRLWWTYVGRVYWPLNPTIVDRWERSHGIGWLEVVSMSSLVGVSLYAAYALWRRWAISIFLFWFLIWMLPASGILPLRHFYAERYLYPGMWGLISVGIWSVFRVLEKHPRARIVALFIVLMGLALETYTENKYWWNDEVLFERAVQQNPAYVEGRIGLAAQSLKCNDFERAIDETRKALISANDSRFVSYWSPFIAHTNAGLAYHGLGQFENATQHFKQALRARPNNAIAFYHLGMNASALRNFVEAKEFYELALQWKPNDYLSQSNLGYVFLNLNQPQECIRVLSPLLVANPSDIVNLANLASALLISGQLVEAERRFTELVSAEPNNPVYLAKRAWVEWKLEKKDIAKKSLVEAANLAPDDPTVRGIAAIILNDNKGRGAKK